MTNRAMYEETGLTITPKFATAMEASQAMTVADASLVTTATTVKISRSCLDHRLETY